MIKLLHYKSFNYLYTMYLPIMYYYDSYYLQLILQRIKHNVEMTVWFSHTSTSIRVQHSSKLK